MSERGDIFSQLIELSRGSPKGPGNLQYFSTEKPRQRGCGRNEKERFLGRNNSGEPRIEAYLFLIMTTEFHENCNLAVIMSLISRRQIVVYQ